MVNRLWLYPSRSISSVLSWVIVLSRVIVCRWGRRIDTSRLRRSQEAVELAMWVDSEHHAVGTVSADGLFAVYPNWSVRIFDFKLESGKVVGLIVGYKVRAA